MNAHTRLGFCGIVAIILSCGVASAAEQQQVYHKPMAPIGPTSEAQCQALEADWSAVCQRITDTHQQCLDANKNPSIPGANGCSKAPCLSLHQQMDGCGGAERRDAVSSCYASVRAHKTREAEFKAAQDAALRAQQEAERQRRERFAADAAKANMEADLARRRAEEYRRQTRRPSSIRPDLDGRQASIVGDLRSEAERAAARRGVPLPGPMPVPAGPPPTPPPYEAIDNATLPELSTPLGYLGKVATALKLPGLKESVDVLQWFAAIHDGRRAEAESARAMFNESFRRDRPNDVNFNLDDCNQFTTYCMRVFEQFSPETTRRYNQYMDKQSRYIAWTDMANLTGKGWTEQEKTKFMLSVGDKLGKKTVEKIFEWSKEPNWDRKDRGDRSLVLDAAKSNLKKKLDQYFPAPKAPAGTALTPNFSDEAVAEYWRLTREYQRRVPRTEPDPLDEILGRMPTVPVPGSPAVPIGGWK
jgi:hypothetical protein